MNVICVKDDGCPNYGTDSDKRKGRRKKGIKVVELMTLLLDEGAERETSGLIPRFLLQQMGRMAVSVTNQKIQAVVGNVTVIISLG